MFRTGTLTFQFRFKHIRYYWWVVFQWRRNIQSDGTGRVRRKNNQYDTAKKGAACACGLGRSRSVAPYGVRSTTTAADCLIEGNRTPDPRLNNCNKQQQFYACQ